MLLGLVTDARASSSGAATCQLSKPTNTNIELHLLLEDVNPTGQVTIGAVAVRAVYNGTTFGPYYLTAITLNGPGLPVAGDPIQIACNMFNETFNGGPQPTLASKILSDIGLAGTQMMFTACSVLGPGSAIPDPCKKALVGSGGTPIGWNAVPIPIPGTNEFTTGGVIIGYPQ
jgi:hypothetical protein